MAGTLIQTKLRVPRERQGLVDRQRVTARLARAEQSRLTLVSAPPGFGKTTLMAQWARDRRDGGWAIGWVSLDPGDDDPARFWQYVLAAVESGAREAGQEVDLAGAPTADGGVDLGALVNAVDALSVELALVLDDLHVIEDQAIHEDLASLLDRAPDGLHLAVTTRADPPLPLARLRARGDLTEVRAADLRFDQDEASVFLRDAMGLDLSTEQVATLEARTEGWVAALQLAALSMAHRADAGAFIERFAGNDRFVVDYLADEVLARQSDTTRAFLLRTSILDRLTGPLCDAVTGQEDARGVLDRLDRANLFLVPLDDERRWFRYHHLFADVLRARLLDEEPDAIPELHRRASGWWEDQGDLPAAIDHALAGGDDERAADLIEVAAHGLRQERRERTLRGWLDALPESVFERRPMLAIVHVGVLLQTGEPDRVEERLRDAERWVAAARDEAAREAAVASGMVVHRLDVLHHLPSAIALHRAGLARMAGDHEATVRHARTALAAAGRDRPLERGGAAGILALAAWSQGDLEVAADAWSEAIRNLDLAGHHADILGCSIGLADIRIAQGRLHDARRTYEAGLGRVDRAGGPLRGTADMHVGLAELHLEWDDLAEARRHMETSAVLDEGLGLPQQPYRWRVASALLMRAEGRLDQALGLLDEAERRYDADFFPEVRPIAAVRARLRLAQGRTPEASAWARDAGVSLGDELSYVREYAHLTLAAVLLADTAVSKRSEASAAIDLLERIARGAEAGGRARSQIEALALLAAARAAIGDLTAARTLLDRVLRLAAPEGFIRTVRDAHPLVAPLLRDAAMSGAVAAEARRVLGEADAPVMGARRPRTTQGLVEPLSARELDVLRLLASDLDGPAIARELYVSLNTMRTHTKNIFAKLGVNSRREAVRRGRELGVIGGGRGR